MVNDDYPWMAPQCPHLTVNPPMSVRNFNNTRFGETASV